MDMCDVRLSTYMYAACFPMVTYTLNFFLCFAKCTFCKMFTQLHNVPAELFQLARAMHGFVPGRDASNPGDMYVDAVDNSAVEIRDTGITGISIAVTLTLYSTTTSHIYAQHCILAQCCACAQSAVARLSTVTVLRAVFLHSPVTLLSAVNWHAP